MSLLATVWLLRQSLQGDAVPAPISVSAARHKWRRRDSNPQPPPCKGVGHCGQWMLPATPVTRASLGVAQTAPVTCSSRHG